MPAPQASAHLRCPNCQYSLVGLPSRVCPECGLNLDPVVVRWRTRTVRRRHWWLSLNVMAFAMYAPFGWLLFIDYPWNSYHWLWVRMWPILPGLPATILLRSFLRLRLPDWAEMMCMGVFALSLLGLFTWLGTRGKRWLIFTAAAGLALSCCNGWVGYLLFQL